MIESLAGWVMLQWGWRRALLSMVLGAVSVLALPPVGLFPVLFVTLPSLVWLIDGALAETRPSLRSAAVIGWCFGFGYLVAGLWWMGSALLVEAEAFAMFLPLAIIGVPAALAVYFAIATVIARLVWPNGVMRIIALAAALALTEMLRGILFTGFPWNLFAHGFATHDILLQPVSVLGIDGLNFLVILIAASPAALAEPAGRNRILLPAFSLLLLASVVGFGAHRLDAPTIARSDQFAIRIVQPAIDQADKWNPEHRDRIINTLLSMSDQASGPNRSSAADTDLVIWPESALPLLLDSDPNTQAAIAETLPLGTRLATGMQRVEGDLSDPANRKVYNSVFLLDDEAQPIKIYDKNWLVPFGEFLPFQPVLEQLGLRQLTNILGGFEPGKMHTLLGSGNMPRALPLICYEIVFGPSVAKAAHDAEWVLNLTNDAWFGRTIGPHQHFVHARIRAAELGLPVIRVANTGISAIIDPFGRVVAKLELGDRSILDGEIPARISPTWYARNSKITGILLPAALIFLLGVVFLRKKR